MGVFVYIYFLLPVLTLLAYIADMKKTGTLFLSLFLVMSFVLFS